MKDLVLAETKDELGQVTSSAMFTGPNGEAMSHKYYKFLQALAYLGTYVIQRIVV